MRCHSKENTRFDVQTYLPNSVEHTSLTLDPKPTSLKPKALTPKPYTALHPQYNFNLLKKGPDTGALGTSAETVGSGVAHAYVMTFHAASPHIDAEETA